MNKKTNNCSPIGEIGIDGKTFCLHKLINDSKYGLNINLSNRLDPTRKLHRYGQGPFCEFKIKNHLNEKGLYCYVVNGDIKYIGKVTGNSTFGKRFNGGYGHISPYNCYKKENGHSGGRLTNCHINSIVNKEFLNGSDIYVGFYVMENDIDISNLEKKLIEDKHPEWNIQYNQQLKIPTSCFIYSMTSDMN